jgi:hypothetical protein
VLEIGDDVYTRRFGGHQVERREVLHLVSGNPAATIIGNLETGDGIPINCMTCIILTQTLQYTYEIRKAIDACHKALQSEGVLLATLPGISQISRYDMDRWGDYWRFTSRSALKLFGEVFGEENIKVETHGNVFAASAFLYGFSVQDLRKRNLDLNDPDYELVITVRARKV